MKLIKYYLCIDCGKTVKKMKGSKRPVHCNHKMREIENPGRAFQPVVKDKNLRINRNRKATKEG